MDNLQTTEVKKVTLFSEVLESISARDTRSKWSPFTYLNNIYGGFNLSSSGIRTGVFLGRVKIELETACPFDQSTTMAT